MDLTKAGRLNTRLQYSKIGRLADFDNSIPILFNRINMGANMQSKILNVSETKYGKC